MSDSNPTPTEEEIAALARSYWEEEGQPEGKAEEHWRRAEEALGKSAEETVLPEPAGN